MFCNDDCTGALSAFRKNGKVYVSDGLFYVTRNDVIKAISLFQEYVDTFTDEEIKALNEIEEYKMHHPEPRVSPQEKKKKMNEGYVYLFECGGKHKIGFSKNVEQRMKQLDTRPFPLTLVCKVYSNIAYDIEQELHRKMEHYRETGEWYDFGCEVPQDSFNDTVKRIEQRLLDEQEGM